MQVVAFAGILPELRKWQVMGSGSASVAGSPRLMLAEGSWVKIQVSDHGLKRAASYGYGFAKNHCFPDGNKRVALISIAVFLLSNGYELIASEVDAVVTIRSVASGDMDEQELSAWIENNSVKVDE